MKVQIILSGICIVLTITGCRFLSRSEQTEREKTPPFDNTLSAKQMQEDIDFYYNSLFDLHPNLDARYSKDSIIAAFLQLKKACSSPAMIGTFFYRLAGLNHLFDLHTGIVSNNVRQGLPWIEFRQDSMFLEKRPILLINDVPATSIAQRVDQLVTWEVNDDTRLYRKNQLMIPALQYIFYQKAPYIFLLKNGDSIDTLTVNGKNINQLLCWKTDRSFNKTHHTPVISSLFYPADSIAILYYNTSRTEHEKTIKKACRSFFKEVRKQQIKYLFIDISQNGGGSDLMHRHITNYLKQNCVKLTTNIRRTVEGIKVFENRLSWFAYLRYMLLGKRRVKATTQPGGYTSSYTNRGNDGRKVFQGDFFVITGSTTYSAGFGFCERIKYSGFGTIVGMPAGQRSPFSAEGIGLLLPHSKRYFKTATKFITNEKCITDEEGFLQPDIPYPLDHQLELEDYKKIIMLNNELKLQ